MKNIVFILLLMLTTLGCQAQNTKKVIHIKATVITKYNYMASTQAYVLDTSVTSLNEFYIVPVDTTYELYHKNAFGFKQIIINDAVVIEDGVIVLDSYGESTRFAYEPKTGKFIAFVNYHQELNKFLYFLEFKVTVHEKINMKKFLKDTKPKDVKNIDNKDEDPFQMTENEGDRVVKSN